LEPSHAACSKRATFFIGSHVVEIGGVSAQYNSSTRIAARDINAVTDASEVRVLDDASSDAIKARIDAAREAGDTVGGVFEVVVEGLPIGLGSYVHWDRKLDGRLAQALMSIHCHERS
jgi:chorismate synthase